MCPGPVPLPASPSVREDAGGVLSGGEIGDGLLPAGLLAHVAGRVDLGERDLPGRVDQERGAQGHAGPLVEGVVGLGGRTVRPEVAEQREVEALLLTEAFRVNVGSVLIARTFTPAAVYSVSSSRSWHSSPVHRPEKANG